MKRLDQDYIYVNDKYRLNKSEAWIVLPEIYGINGFIRHTVDGLASRRGILCLAVDHLYSGTGKAEVFDYTEGRDEAFAAMESVTGEGFIGLLEGILDAVQMECPEIKSFTVLGFCFGGRLAFLSGIDSRVKRVVSFYGGGPHTPFYEGLGSVEALVKLRTERDLEVVAFYGAEDGMIPAQDRNKTRDLLLGAGFKFSDYVYDCGHAFANFERDSYSQEAAQKAWQVVGEI